MDTNIALQHTSVASLEDGESVALLACQLKIVNDEAMAAVAGGAEKADGFVAQIASELLTELHGAYAGNLLADGLPRDVAVELLWVASPVEHRPYDAEISLYLIVRTIDDSPQEASSAACHFMSLCTNALERSAYSYSFVRIDDLQNVIASISDESIVAIRKTERIDDLQAGGISFGFDRMPTDMANFSDLDSVASLLHDCPNCVISVQLIPTYYSQAEQANLNAISTQLAMMAAGSFQMMPIPLAVPASELYSFYSSAANGPLFLFNVILYGTSAYLPVITSRLTGFLGGKGDGASALTSVNLASGEVNKSANFFPLPWAVNEVMSNKGRMDAIWSDARFGTFWGCRRFPDIITANEAASFFRWPSRELNSAPKVNAGGIPVGRMRASSRGDVVDLGLNDLAKHMLIVGTPGSGKTNFSIGLLDQLWREHGVPFLVIEPAKNEYRALVSTIPDLQVFTPGKDFISPFVMNPFIPPDGVRLQSYKSTLKTAFSAAVSMETPLDKLFEDTIANCYSEAGWLDSYRMEDGGRVFNIEDFIACFSQTFEAIGYKGDASNIGRAGLLRLRGLSALFDSYHSIPIGDLLSRPTIIELAAIENQEQKALIIALLLLQILSYVNANYVGEGDKLNNFILLEEAHVLLDGGPAKKEGAADPSAIAKGLVVRILAELRSLGVALAIADQSPRKVGTDVVSLTDIKLAFRLVEAEDRHILAQSTSMGAESEDRLSRLQVGEAFIYYNKLIAPEEVITPNYRAEHNIAVTITDDEIAERSTYWSSRAEKLRPYPECEWCLNCDADCDAHTRELGRSLANNIFRARLKDGENDPEAIKQVLNGFTGTVAETLGRAPSRRELGCTLLHMLRLVRYHTSIPINDTSIHNLLSKVEKDS